MSAAARQVPSSSSGSKVRAAQFVRAVCDDLDFRNSADGNLELISQLEKQVKAGRDEIAVSESSC